jgi:metallo-beta-lactamase class B
MDYIYSMKKHLQYFLFGLLFFISPQANAQTHKKYASKIVYKSELLVITQISENAFTHVSYLQTNDFGNVPCNGLVVKSDNEVVIYDTPTNDTVSNVLIKWVSEYLNSKIVAIIPTHFHNDCLGGLNAFHDSGISSFANNQTIALAKLNNYTLPLKGFDDSLVLKFGNQTTIIKHFGEGHTRDNVVGYFPSENILFGGCLIKELDATKGYLGDANVYAWSNTVSRIKKAYPNLKIVIPGHGEIGDTSLLDYTISLFK